MFGQISPHLIRFEFDFGEEPLNLNQYYKIGINDSVEINSLRFYISSVELGESKVDNPYDTFKDFYTKDFQLFVDYNIQDVALVENLENKLKFIELTLTIAYSAKILYEDVFSPIKTWDVIIYNYLNNK